LLLSYLESNEPKIGPIIKPIPYIVESCAIEDILSSFDVRSLKLNKVIRI